MANVQEYYLHFQLRGSIVAENSFAVLRPVTRLKALGRNTQDRTWDFNISEISMYSRRRMADFLNLSLI